MAAMKIKKGDMVRVIAGKEAAQVVQDKDKKPAEGKVLSVDAKRGRVVVEGLHKVTREALDDQPEWRTCGSGSID